MRLAFGAWLMAVAACAADSDGGAGTRPGEPEDSGTATTPPADSARDAGDVRTGDEQPGPAASYAAALQKSSHNSYERLEPLLDQLVYHRIRSIELDIHTGKSGESSIAGDWFVYHEDLPLFRDTSCTKLSDCLGQLAAFQRTFPRHEVVTVFVDLKDGFGAGHTSADLDALLSKVLGRTTLFAPGDAKERCPGATTLRAAVTGTCTFPKLADLRGKVVVAITGGFACDAASRVMTYDGSLAFRAPNHSAACTAAKGDDVFVNLSWDERAQAKDARSLGLVTRIYKGGVPGGLDTKEDFEGAIAAGALHLATDKANADQDGWARTHDDRGFPFRCEGCEGHVEPGALLGVRAASGDQWGNADSAFYALVEDGAAQSGEDTWTALVSVPSSHTAESAKACVVARASGAPGAIYAAVCRTFDVGAPRMQVRASEGGVTTSTTSPSIAGVGGEVPAFLRLRVKPNGTHVDVTGEASTDGEAWKTIGTTTLDGALPLRGVAVSSHDGAMRKALFAGVRRNGSAVPLSALTKRIAVGSNASGEAFEGVAP